MTGLFRGKNNLKFLLSPAWAGAEGGETISLSTSNSEESKVKSFNPGLGTISLDKELSSFHQDCKLCFM